MTLNVVLQVPVLYTILTQILRTVTTHVRLNRKVYILYILIHVVGI